jgi:hypothetical protein
MRVTLEGIEMDARLAQSWNAPRPMLVTLEEIKMDARVVQPQNA